ncbi:MAG: acyltransferase [Rhodocyclaceae bacterium]|nr:acyltransferase [Rhodocyclaceae bacterium]MBX3668086.1 acyltransferase [Rhodocyclaceae bacterium]
MPSLSQRFDVVDAAKAAAVVFIMLHHFAAYGPLSDAAGDATPGLIAWFYEYGRLAVQVFLVCGGYLAARALAPDGQLSVAPAIAVANRYLRLALPFLAAVVLAIAASELAAQWMEDDEFISAAPRLGQLLAHAALLQGVLHYESLSAGAWYVAIDFQLFALLAALLWLARVLPGQAEGRRKYGVLIVLALALASTLWFNRQPQLDDWAPYFFASYAMGVFAYWAGRGLRTAQIAQSILLYVALVGLLLEFRIRVPVAIATALLLHLSHAPALRAWRAPRRVAQLARISYSLFLVHVSVYLLVSAAFLHFDLDDTALGGFAGVALSLALSVGFATLFHRRLEAPAASLRFGPARRPVPGSFALGAG